MYIKGNKLHKQAFDNKRRIIYSLFIKHKFSLDEVAKTLCVSKPYVHQVFNNYFLRTSFNYNALGWSL